ncbi:MAG: sodium:proton antiporter [Planctomycetaceae bacterium]|nr:sodium:proton antiporter [Planctomycetaceae bacterium]
MLTIVTRRTNLRSLTAMMVSLTLLLTTALMAQDSAENKPSDAATEVQEPAPTSHATTSGASEEGHGGSGTATTSGHGGGHTSLGTTLGLWTVGPFIALLLCIAVLPLAAPHWWEHNKNKGIVAAVLGIPLAGYLALSFGADGQGELLHAAKDYVSFICLLGSLYVISGGVFVRGSLDGTPLLNTALLALGAVLASFVGTTGASVLLIRPLLRANQPRKQKAHIVVFFIFVVSNCGGLLTALGDPPLFIGFLKGVPFLWTLRLAGQWALVNGLLLVIFMIWDQFVFNREEKERAGSQLEAVMQHQKFGIDGSLNFAFLGGILATVYLSGSRHWQYGVQESLMVLLLLASYFTTSRDIHSKNKFTFGPIIEVAVLFAGIFVTMIPALLILNANGKSMGIAQPWQFFWATGVLSSFLDNAPTYLTFAATACGIQNIQPEGQYLAQFLNLPAEANAVQILAAISCGAVFMGANTYIGNGPNFMVKAIAEENGVKMPSFFGYMAYSGAILIPIFVIVTFVFFRG